MQKRHIARNFYPAMDEAENKVTVVEEIIPGPAYKMFQGIAQHTSPTFNYRTTAGDELNPVGEGLYRSVITGKLVRLIQSASV